ncbi:hypothetical protein KKF84_00580 [Myxococcota bacterium]|nr:hypothetical protein [Myxococcota bacterium]
MAKLIMVLVFSGALLSCSGDWLESNKSNPSCPCVEGETTCSGDSVMFCAVTDGCGQWEEEADCWNYGGECREESQGHAWCENLSCNNIACNPGALYCQGTLLYRCYSDYCGGWEVAADCADSGQVCVGNPEPEGSMYPYAECADSCVGDCDEPGTYICSEDNVVILRCEDHTACNHYVEDRNCEYSGQLCEEDESGYTACVTPEE